MTSYYECHITMIGNPVEIEEMVKTVRWTFSRIDGDPVLGDGVKCYATKHFNMRMTLDFVMDEVNGAAAALYALGADVMRRKVEVVVYDNREPLTDENQSLSE